MPIGTYYEKFGTNRGFDPPPEMQSHIQDWNLAPTLFINVYWLLQCFESITLMVINYGVVKSQGNKNINSRRIKCFDHYNAICHNNMSLYNIKYEMILIFIKFRSIPKGI